MASVIEVPRDLTDPAGHGGDIVEFNPIDAPEGRFDEAWLQEALRRCPDVLPVEEFGPVFHPLRHRAAAVQSDKHGGQSRAAGPVFGGTHRSRERSIVEVTVQGATAAQVAVRQDRYQDEAVRSKRISLKSEDAFWELITEQAPDPILTARTLIDKFRSDERFALGLREASIVVESEVPETEVSVPLFFLKSNGKLVCWIRTIGRRLRVAGLLESVSDEYEATMRAVLASPTNPRELARAVDEVSMVGLYDAADRFVRQIEKGHRKRS